MSKLVKLIRKIQKNEIPKKKNVNTLNSLARLDQVVKNHVVQPTEK